VSDDVTQVRAQRRGWEAAFAAGDVDAMTMFYADVDELVLFDIYPPLRFVGPAANRQNWVGFFANFEGDQRAEAHEETIEHSGDLAFVRNLTRMRGTMGGRAINTWSRETNCLRRIDRQWLIVHAHVSFPVDLQSGQAQMTLTP